VAFDEFSLLSLPNKFILRFCLGISKNWKIYITHCFINWHKLAVDYPISDVIDT
jgi:hypothetical protein